MVSRDRPSGRPDWQVRAEREEQEHEERVKRNRAMTDDKPTCECGRPDKHEIWCRTDKPKKPPTWEKQERDLLKYLLRLNYGPSLKKRIPKIVAIRRRW